MNSGPFIDITPPGVSPTQLTPDISLPLLSVNRGVNPHTNWTCTSGRVVAGDESAPSSNLVQLEVLFVVGGLNRVFLGEDQHTRIA